MPLNAVPAWRPASAADPRAAPQVQALISYREHEPQAMIVLAPDYRLAGLSERTLYRRLKGLGVA